MAYINVAEWTPDQVTDWLKGLDNSMYKYVNSFANNEIKGHTLLNIRPYELDELGVTSIGHQEIVLEAIEQLRNFNYVLEKENLQFLALRVATTAKNLHNQLAHYSDKSKIETQILNDISRAIGTIKPLVGWLDRSPFQGQIQFNEIRKRILRLGIEMATSAHRDRFVENPVDQIRLTAEKVAKLADYIIQDISDPIILQPATLNLVTLKKRESELGFNIAPNYHGIHIITDIKYNSPAHISGKIEDGDEIIQINYQTVVGWHYKRVLQQLQESPPDVLLTLKKRPRHTKIYGQIYMKPYRLPSKKRTLPYRFEENLPSPRIEFTPTQNFLPLTEKSNLTDSDSSSSSSILIPAESTKSNEKDLRLYLSKPRAVLQRRNTICGDQASGFRSNITFWHEMNVRRNFEGNSLRDKSVSFGFGLEMSLDKRPITCIGIHDDLGNTLKSSIPDIKAVNIKQLSGKSTTNDLNEDMVAKWNGVKTASDEIKTKVVKFKSVEIKSAIESNEYTKDPKTTKTAEDIPNFDSVPDLPIKLRQLYSPNSIETAEATPIKNNPKQLIEKNQNNDDKPPEIGPRKEFLKKVAPRPPPRPSKAAELVQRKFDMLKEEIENEDTSELCLNPILDDSHEVQKFIQNNTAICESKLVEKSLTLPLLDVSKLSVCPNQIQTPPRTIFFKYSNSDSINEESELLTPNRTKTLTLKKKNSILAKRRKICLKTLEFSDIQGHLFRRTKDKHGVTYWAKFYFVLVETALYGFQNKKSQKANCLIFLPGFTVSLAKEVHSKPYAYKVYHPKKTFYFAAESQEALSQWMDYIKRATLKGITASLDPMLVERIDSKDLFSETDDENELTSKDTLQPIVFKKSMLGVGKTNKKRNSRGNSNDNTSPTMQSKSERYHLGFGSLKKFTNLHNLPFSSNKTEKEREDRKKIQSDIPVPTAQYKSYRKIPGNAGMQLGSNTLVDYNMMTQRLQQSHSNVPSVPTSVISEQITTKLSQEFGKESRIKSSANNEPILSQIATHNASKAPISPNESSPGLLLQTKSEPLVNKSISKLSKNKTSPFNYMHASNPNLVEFTFQTSKSLDVGMPKVNVSNTFDQLQNLQGFITLKDLMLQREEDEAHNMYNNRVNLGVEKPIDRHIRRKHRRPNECNENDRTADEHENTPQIGQKQTKNKIQRRSLPKTPDYAQSFKADDTEIIMARSKEGQKLRDFGYEFISGDGNVVSNKKLVKTNQKFILPTKRKGLNWIGLSLDSKRNDDDKIISKGSFRICNKQKHPDISDTTKNDGVNEFFSQANYLSKLTFPSKTVKEKRLLGSPRLHRAASSIFGRKTMESPTHDHDEYGSPALSSIDQTNNVCPNVNDSRNLNRSEYIVAMPSSITSSVTENIEYPPIFISETYSLRDQN